MMEKQNIKLGFTDTYENAILFFTEVLSRRYNIIRDDVSPDYLIFGDPNFGQSHYQYQNCKKIFFTGENYKPTYFTHDYAISFQHVNSLQHYRLPLYVLEMWAIAREDGPWKDDYLYLVQKHIDVEKEYVSKMEGITYVQSNPNVTTRNEFFDFLVSNGKNVVSAGPHKNNTGWILDRPGGHKDKIEFLSKYKFNIAYENGRSSGYVTEKLLNAFYANTIPIYWGSQLIDRDFNKKAFINASNASNEHILEQINDLENDKQKYLDMLAQPAFKDDIPPSATNLNNFLDWWEQTIL